MYTKTYFAFFALAATIFFTSCKEKEVVKKPEIEPSLKEKFSKDFYIGAALSQQQILGLDSMATKLIEQQFNSITPENCMKSVNIHPKKDSLVFEVTDKYVELGEKNNMFIMGHTLVWHSQLAEWMQNIESGDSLSYEIKKHIDTIVSRYKGRVHGYDVVNEALNEDGSLRESVFFKKIGKEFLVQAFQQTAKNDPEAELYYNDYNLCQPEKRNGAVEIVKYLQENDAKIDGVGIQAHWGLESPELGEIEKSILAFSELGVKVMFTELDITVLPNPWDLVGAGVEQNFENNEKMNPYPKSLPDSVSVKLAERYKDIFNLFLKHKEKISRVTFWGVHDGQSWLNNWPIEGRTNYPLLFDTKYQPKIAYDALMKLN
ncbi:MULTISPECIES: endo-1,4-beta-xylanase [Flavobacteriaceae]|uniref:endo-1,4-beta-xylanase n=1 Tax=Flavobacteriaceae TaxID=49546 RepID=UPI001491CA4D|nr:MULTISPECIES: endo-1,4-beta-xylanase [Allomuricauda]MDC6367695.1 endo-1,4-beta-xylanase [Muricauda sp. AC10]